MLARSDFEGLYVPGAGWNFEYAQPTIARGCKCPFPQGPRTWPWCAMRSRDWLNGWAWTRPRIADLKTVVTEACMNVVVHAYAGERAGTARGRGESRARRAHRRRPRPRHRDPPAARHRAPEPADRADPDRGPLQQLRDQGRGRPRHRDPHAPAAAGARGRRPAGVHRHVPPLRRPGSGSGRRRSSARSSAAL